MATTKLYNFDDILNDASGRLCIAIGKGNFREELSLILQQQIGLAYDRAIANAKVIVVNQQNAPDPNFREPIPAYADHMKVGEFIKRVGAGLCSPEDGTAFYAEKTGMTRIEARSDDIATERWRKDFSHVVWFNK